jgi:hypothetical protein
MPADAAPVPTVDAGRDDPDAAPSEPAGVVFRFVTNDPVPGEIEQDGVSGTVDLASFEFQDIRAIGDAAPGDDRTRRGQYRIDWREDETPNPLSFPDAPPGIYSLLLARVVRYEVHGSVKWREEQPRYIIEDRPEVALSIAVELPDVEAQPGQVVVVEIEVDVNDIVTAIDWSEREPDDDEFRVGSEDEAIEEVRSEVTDAFEHEGTQYEDGDGSD